MSVINVKNCHISFITEGEEGAIVYDTPKAMPNLMKADITAVFAEAKNYGDGVISQTESKMQGANIAVEFNRVPLDIQAAMFGREIENGEMVISTNDVPKSFAIGWEEDIGGGKSEYCWFYDCKAVPMSKSSQQSTDNITFGSDTLTISAKGRDKDGKIAKIADTTDPLFLGGETWFSKVETV